MKKRHKKAQTTRRVTHKTSDLGKAKALYCGKKKEKKIEADEKDQLLLEGMK